MVFDKKTILKIVASVAIIGFTGTTIIFTAKYFRDKKKAKAAGGANPTTGGKTLKDAKGNVIVSHKTTEINPSTGANYTPEEITIVDKIKSGRG